MGLTFLHYTVCFEIERQSVSEDRQRQSLRFEKKLWKQIMLEREMPECCENKKKQESLYILHVSVWFHLPGPLWLLPDVVFIIYPASIGQYWSRLSALLPYWQQDNGVSNNNGSEKEEAAVLHYTAHSVWSESLFAQLDIHESTRFIKVWCSHLATSI